MFFVFIQTNPTKLVNCQSASLAPALAITLLAFLLPVNQAHAQMQFVPVGNPGNPAQSASNRSAADTGGDGFGAVASEFEIGKFEVSLAQYTEFLNAKAKSDPYGLYNPTLATDEYAAGISRTGSSGSYVYTVIGTGARPVTFVSWYDAARFCNWMHNGQGAGNTETGAYNLNGATSGAFNPQPGAKFRLPTEDEWFKAAYYDPQKVNADGSVGGYWLHATRRDTMTSNARTAPGAANYNDGNHTKVQNSLPSNLTDGGYFLNSPSYYQTFDQAGNLNEWLGTRSANGNPRVRGGAWLSSEVSLRSSSPPSLAPSSESSGLGFRIVKLNPVANQPPVFTVNPIPGAAATQGVAYSGTLAGTATDPDGGTLNYFKA